MTGPNLRTHRRIELTANRQPALSQEILDIPVAQGEPEVEPDSVSDDIWRKSGGGHRKWASWPELLSHTPAHLFVNVSMPVKRTLDDDGRKEIVEMLWDVAFADGAIHEFQANTIWRIAELLGVSTRDRVLLRQRRRTKICRRQI